VSLFYQSVSRREPPLLVHLMPAPDNFCIVVAARKGQPSSPPFPHVKIIHPTAHKYPPAAKLSTVALCYFILDPFFPIFLLLLFPDESFRMVPRDLT